MGATMTKSSTLNLAMRPLTVTLRAEPKRARGYVAIDASDGVASWHIVFDGRKMQRALARGRGVQQWELELEAPAKQVVRKGKHSMLADSVHVAGGGRMLEFRSDKSAAFLELSESQLAYIDRELTTVQRSADRAVQGVA